MTETGWEVEDDAEKDAAALMSFREFVFAKVRPSFFSGVKSSTLLAMLLSHPDRELLLSSRGQAILVQALCRSRWSMRFPLSAVSVHRFWNGYLRMVEDERLEIADDLIECTFGGRTENDRHMFYRIYEFAGAQGSRQLFHQPLDELALHCDCVMRHIVVRCTDFMRETGTVEWQAGLFLAEWAIAHPQRMAGRRILELGSGIGVAGIAIAKYCQPAAVCLTDGFWPVLENLLHNVSVNVGTGTGPGQDDKRRDDGDCSLASDAVSVAELNWQDGRLTYLSLDGQPAAAALPLEGYDFLVGADLVYDLDAVEHLVGLLSRLLAPPASPACLLALTYRSDTTFQFLLVQLAAYSVSYEYEQTTAEAHASTPHLFMHYDRSAVRFMRIWKSTSSSPGI